MIALDDREQAMLLDMISIMAYDDGCTDSGMHNEVRREEIKEWLHSLDEAQFRMKLSPFIRDYFLSDEALAEGYGLSDVNGWIHWLANYMDFDL
jgi:hypothetical protein